MQNFREELSVLFNEIELLRDLSKFYLPKYSLRGLPLDINNLKEYLNILVKHYYIPFVSCDIYGSITTFTVSYNGSWGLGYGSTLSYNSVTLIWRLDCIIDSTIFENVTADEAKVLERIEGTIGNSIINFNIKPGDTVQGLEVEFYRPWTIGVKSSNLEDLVEHGFYYGFNHPVSTETLLIDPYHL